MAPPKQELVIFIRYIHTWKKPNSRFFRENVLLSRKVKSLSIQLLQMKPVHVITVVVNTGRWAKWSHSCHKGGLSRSLLRIFTCLRRLLWRWDWGSIIVNISIGLGQICYSLYWILLKVYSDYKTFQSKNLRFSHIKPTDGDWNIIWDKTGAIFYYVRIAYKKLKMWHEQDT